MNVIVEFNGIQKKIYCDESCDAIHAKELACCEFSLSPAFTRVYFNGQILLGEKLLEEFGITDGAVLKVESASL